MASARKTNSRPKIIAVRFCFFMETGKQILKVSCLYAEYKRSLPFTPELEPWNWFNYDHVQSGGMSCGLFVDAVMLTQ